MDETLQIATAGSRFQTFLLLVFAGIALALLAMGIGAALAEWKFRPIEPPRHVMPATAPASQES